MGSSFLGFDIATRSLDIARGNMGIINNNITNANTPGYSRQLAVQAATKPMYSGDGKGMQGTGAAIVGIERQRDSYIDYKYWNANSKSGEYAVKQTQIGQIETLIKEPSEGGFEDSINNFFDAMQKASTNPADKSVRSSLMQESISLTKYFNSTAEELKAQQKELNFSIKTKVEEVNAIANQIQSLNGQILKMEVSGDTANDLRDQRDMLIDKLSGIINTSVDYRTNNGVEECIVRINNQVLVDNISVNELTVETRAANKNDSDVDNLYDIKWKNGLAFNMYDDNMTGELRGYIDARDGNNSDVGYKGIPHYMEQLNKFARTFAMAINEGKHLDGTRIEGIDSGHIDGYGQNDTTGNYLFSYRDTNGDPVGKAAGALDYTKITAENFSLSAEVMDSTENISLSDEDGNTSNNEIAEQINLLRNNASVFKEGKIMDFMNSVMSEAAIDVNQAKRVTSSQANVLKTITNQRLSVSGVDINEEMMNLMKFQNAYSASAKVLQVLNEIYNITINGIGL